MFKLQKPSTFMIRVLLMMTLMVCIESTETDDDDNPVFIPWFDAPSTTRAVDINIPPAAHITAEIILGPKDDSADPRTVTFSAKKTDTLSRLRTIIQKKYGIATDLQQITMNGKLLTQPNDHESLEHLGFATKTTIKIQCEDLKKDEIGPYDVDLLHDVLLTAKEGNGNFNQSLKFDDPKKCITFLVQYGFKLNTEDQEFDDYEESDHYEEKIYCENNKVLLEKALEHNIFDIRIYISIVLATSDERYDSFIISRSGKLSTLRQEIEQKYGISSELSVITLYDHLLDHGQDSKTLEELQVRFFDGSLIRIEIQTSAITSFAEHDLVSLRKIISETYWDKKISHDIVGSFQNPTNCISYLVAHGFILKNNEENEVKKVEFMRTSYSKKLELLQIAMKGLDKFDPEITIYINLPWQRVSSIKIAFNATLSTLRKKIESEQGISEEAALIIHNWKKLLRDKDSKTLYELGFTIYPTITIRIETDSSSFTEHDIIKLKEIISRQINLKEIIIHRSLREIIDGIFEEKRKCITFLVKYGFVLNHEPITTIQFGQNNKDFILQAALKSLEEREGETYR